MDWVLQSCRFFHFAATMAVFGAAAFRCYALVDSDIDRAGLFWFDVRLIRFESMAAIIGLLSAVALLFAVTASMAGAASGAFDPATLNAVLLDTEFGAVWRWRLLLAATLVGVCMTPRWRGPTAVLLLAGILLASLGWVGHAAVDQGVRGVAHKLNHSLHLLAAGIWLGGLAPLGWLLQPPRERRRPEELRQLGRVLRQFSRIAALAVGLLAITGAINTVLMLGGREAPLATAYGRLLIAKIALYLVMVGLALSNRFRLAPRIARDPGAIGRLCCAVVLEQGLALAILAVVSVLGTLPPPAEAGPL
jgi:putative copper resistance protein D